MNLWLVLPLLVVLAAVYVFLPVGLTMARHYRDRKLVRCPLSGRAASVHVSRAGVAEVLGIRSLRRVTNCSLWPTRSPCHGACRMVADEAMVALPPRG